MDFNIADLAHFNLVLERIERELGKDYRTIAELLSHNVPRHTIAKELKISFTEVKEKMKQIQVILAEEYTIKL